MRVRRMRIKKQHKEMKLDVKKTDKKKKIEI